MSQKAPAKNKSIISSRRNLREVNEIIEKIKNCLPILSIPQNEADATYSLWRDEEDYHIDWKSSADDIQQFVYSVGYPFKGAYTILDGEKIRVLDCKPLADVIVENRISGKLIFLDNGFPIIVCGKGLLKILSAENEEGQSILPLQKFRARFE